MKNSNAESKSNWDKLILFIVPIVAIYAATIATMNFIKSPQLGYVNSNGLLEKYKAAVSARGKIKKQTDEWQKNVKTLEAELGQLNQEIITKNDQWDIKTRKLKQEAFAKKQNEFLRYGRAVDEKAAKLERDSMAPVFDELNAYIKDFGKERGYDIIFGTVAGGNIVYAREGKDLTDEFLAYVSDKK